MVFLAHNNVQLQRQYNLHALYIDFMFYVVKSKAGSELLSNFRQTPSVGFGLDYCSKWQLAAGK